jgi:predicted transporter
MNNRSLSNFMNIAGFASILASIVIWAVQGGNANKPEEKAHGERFGIFVGLWAPTFFILANRLELAAQDEES